MIPRWSSPRRSAATERTEEAEKVAVGSKTGGIRKRMGNDGSGGGIGGVDLSGDAENKKRKRDPKKQSMFKPQVVLTHSSDTPPEDDDPMENLPPPPSERKIARRRKSMINRGSPGPGAASGSNWNNNEEGLMLAENGEDMMLTTSAGDQAPQVPFLSFSSSSRTTFTGRTPSSPPQSTGLPGIGLGLPPGLAAASGSRSGSSSRIASGSRFSSGAGIMGPPTEFVRKTRKSMKGLDFQNIEVGAGESMVPVPDSETPMIRKNKELREAQRRSSLGMRGQRASSSFGKGEITIPHASVPSNAFHKHISPVIPEPIRARHLIAWCAKRAGDDEVAASSSTSKSKSSRRVTSNDIRTEDGNRLINEIMDDFIGLLGKGEIDTNIFPQMGPQANLSSLKPHPRNVTNRQIEAKEEAVIRRCKEEKMEWSKLGKMTNRRFTEQSELCQQKVREDLEPDMSACSEKWMKEAMSLADGIIKEGEGDLSSLGAFEDVEYKVDTLLQSTHSAVQYSRQARRFLDGVFSGLTHDLRTRGSGPRGESSQLGSTSTEHALSLLSRSSAQESSRHNDPIRLLRAIAAVDAQNPKPEVVEKAKQLEPVNIPLGKSIHASGPGGLNSSIGPGRGTAPTPRRGIQQNGTTPSRTQAAQEPISRRKEQTTIQR